MFGPNSGTAMAEPAVPPTTALIYMYHLWLYIKLSELTHL